MNMLRPEDRLKAIEAFKEDKLMISWGHDGVPPMNWAEKQGWPKPVRKGKIAFIKKMLENDENFSKALISSGIDVYISDYSNPKNINPDPTFWEELLGCLGLLVIIFIVWALFSYGCS